MLELSQVLLSRLRAGERVALATSIDVIGSAPHLAGTSMMLGADGAVAGAVSGGCVEAAALDACRSAYDGAAPSTLRFGFGDAEAARAGLACGGELDVLVHLVGGDALAAELAEAVAGRPAAVGLVTSGPADLVGRIVVAPTGRGLPGDLGVRDHLPPSSLPVSVGRLRAAVDARLAAGRSGPVELDCDGVPLRLFVDVVAAAAHLVIGGATPVAIALATAATAVGYAVTVCDPRPAFADPARFPAGVRVHRGHLHELVARSVLDDRSAVCVLGHDEELDPLAIAVALASGAGYVGALGSRATAARRIDRLRTLGVPEPSIARLHAPIGLDLGASTPAETAVSILAELIAVRSGATGDPLRARSGPIHASRSQTNGGGVGASRSVARVPADTSGTTS